MYKVSEFNIFDFFNLQPTYLGGKRPRFESGEKP